MADLGPKGRKVMAEFGHRELRSGSDHGPVVTDPRQAFAIAKSEERQARRRSRRSSRGSSRRSRR